MSEQFIYRPFGRVAGLRGTLLPASVRVLPAALDQGTPLYDQLARARGFDPLAPGRHRRPGGAR